LLKNTTGSYFYLLQSVLMHLHGLNPSTGIGNGGQAQWRSKGGQVGARAVGRNSTLFAVILNVFLKGY